MQNDHDRMLEKLRGLGPIDPPRVTVGEDGTVDFYWKTDRALIDLGTDGNGEFSWYAKFADGTESYGELDLTQPLPEAIVAALQALADIQQYSADGFAFGVERVHRHFDDVEGAWLEEFWGD